MLYLYKYVIIDYLKNIDSFNWIVFTSPNGLRYFFARLFDLLVAVVDFIPLGTAFGGDLLGQGKGLLPLQGAKRLAHLRREPLVGRLAALGFNLLATEGTAEVIQRAGVPVERVYKVTEGFRPHIVDRMKNGEVAMLVNTPEGRSARLDSYSIRRTAVTMGIPHFTTMAAAEAAAEAIGALRTQQMAIRSLQEYHAAV